MQTDIPFSIVSTPIDTEDSKISFPKQLSIDVNRQKSILNSNSKKSILHNSDLSTSNVFVGVAQQIGLVIYNLFVDNL